MSDLFKAGPHAPEGGHWYQRDGTPVFTVKGAKDQDVTPDIRHARKLGLFPGITTIIKESNKPALNIWIQRQVLLAALTLPRNPGEDDETFIARVMRDSGETARIARDGGTEIHAAVQQFYTNGQVVPGYEEHVAGISLFLLERLGPQQWVPERPLAHPMGFGTKIDLYSNNWLIDFKSKDGDQASLGGEKLYDEHHMQLAAGSAALSYADPHDGRRCGIVFVSRTHPGHCWMQESTHEDLERGWDMFLTLHQYWCLRNRYNPEVWR